MEGLAIPGPEDDPDGWRTLTEIDMVGTLFSSRRVSVMCKVYSL
jgi:hypothetical protein